MNECMRTYIHVLRYGRYTTQATDSTTPDEFKYEFIQN